MDQLAKELAKAAKELATEESGRIGEPGFRFATLGYLTGIADALTYITSDGQMEVAKTFRAVIERRERNEYGDL